RRVIGIEPAIRGRDPVILEAVLERRVHPVPAPTTPERGPHRSTSLLRLLPSSVIHARRLLEPATTAREPTPTGPATTGRTRHPRREPRPRGPRPPRRNSDGHAVLLQAF